MNKRINIPRGVLPLLMLAGAAAPAMAGFSELVTFPAGLVCEFPLKIESDGTGVRIDLQPPAGRWRSISAGTGPDLRLSNANTGASITLQGNGAVVRTQRAEANGSTVTTMTGHNILLMYPTDNPKGPSTTLYVGKVTFANDAQANTTLMSHSGKTLDICAAVAD